MTTKMTYGELTATLAAMKAQLDEMGTFLTGVVAILGRDEVLQAAKDHVADEQRRQEEMLQAQVDTGVKDGWLVPSTVSGLKSLVVGEETSPLGKSRAQVIPASLRPADRGVYIGRQVGEEFDVKGPGGVVIHTRVLGVYGIDEERRKQVIEEHQAKARAEVAAADEAAAEFAAGPDPEGAHAAPPPAPADPA